MFRLLKANEIEARVSTVTEKGVSLLLYKDARCDCRLLDEAVGPMNWQKAYETIDGNLYCTISIYDSEKCAWVSKQDVGVPAMTEKVKSEASDSFKRCAVMWGIGRELYTAPFIWIQADKANIQKRGDKLVCYDRFVVDSVEYDEDRRITGLIISKEGGEVVYSFAKRNKSETDRPISKAQQEELRFELLRTQIPMDDVLKRYNVAAPELLTQTVFDKAMKALKRTKTSLPVAV